MNTIIRGFADGSEGTPDAIAYQRTGGKMDMKRFAVITGDINASSRLGKLEVRHLEKTLRESFRDMAENLPDLEAAHFTCFRGDSWQFVTGDAANAARAAVYFRASLLVRSYGEFGKRLDSAVAIGFGSVDFFPDDESTAGGGEAYELSGKCLDNIRKRIPGMSASGLGFHDPGISAVLGLTDALIRHWTSPQARAVCFAMQGFTQELIAAKWVPEAISQQGVHKHLKNAGWPAVEPALDWIATTIKGCILENNLEKCVP